MSYPVTLRELHDILDKLLQDKANPNSEIILNFYPDDDDYYIQEITKVNEDRPIIRIEIE